MIVIGLILIAIILLFVIIMGILETFDFFAKSTATKLPYKQFIDYYWLNPDKWEMHNTYVEYKHSTREEDYRFVITKGELKTIPYGYRTISKETEFSFSFIDRFKYRKFKHDIETDKAKIEQSKAHNEAYKFLLKGVQEDIDKLRKQSEDELNQAINTMKEVKERIR